MHVDELDFWLSTAHTFSSDGFLYGAILNYHIREQTATELYYKFDRIFSRELILERINFLLTDPEKFHKKITYLEGQRITWPWEKEKNERSHVAEYSQSHPDVAIVEELLIEINNLLHFGENWKVISLMKLAQDHFSVKYSSYKYFLSYIKADIVKRKFFMTGPTSSEWFSIFVGNLNSSLAGIDEKSWWYKEEPESSIIWVHAPLSVSDEVDDSFERIIQKMRECSIYFLASITKIGNLLATSEKPDLLRHSGRIRCYRPTGWYSKVLEAMELSGNRNAKYALKRAFS